MPQSTNVEFVTELMEFSSQGPLMQMFVISALGKYAEAVLQNQEELRESMKDNIVHPDAWIRCAKELKEKLEARNGQ